MGVNKERAVFPGERTGRPALQQIKHAPAVGAAQTYALRGSDKRTVDEDRVDDHRIQQRFLADPFFKKAKFSRRRFGFPQRLTGREAGCCKKREQLRTGPAFPQIVDDHRTVAGCFDDAEDIARGAAVRIVMDNHRKMAHDAFP